MAGFGIRIRATGPSSFRGAAGRFTSEFNRALQTANLELGRRTQELAITAQQETRLRLPTGELERALADSAHVSVMPGGAGVRVFNIALLDQQTAKSTPGARSLEFGYWRIVEFGSAGTAFRWLRPFVILGEGGQVLKPSIGAKDAVKLAQMSTETMVKRGLSRVQISDVTPQRFIARAQEQVLAEIEGIFERHWGSVSNPVTGVPGGFRPRWLGVRAI